MYYSLIQNWIVSVRWTKILMFRHSEIEKQKECRPIDLETTDQMIGHLWYHKHAVIYGDQLDQSAMKTDDWIHMESPFQIPWVDRHCSSLSSQEWSSSGEPPWSTWHNLINILLATLAEEELHCEYDLFPPIPILHSSSVVYRGMWTPLDDQRGKVNPPGKLKKVPTTQNWHNFPFWGCTVLSGEPCSSVVQFNSGLTEAVRHNGSRPHQKSAGRAREKEEKGGKEEKKGERKEERKERKEEEGKRDRHIMVAKHSLGTVKKFIKGTERRGRKRWKRQKSLVFSLCYLNSGKTLSIQ